MTDLRERIRAGEFQPKNKFPNRNDYPDRESYMTARSAFSAEESAIVHVTFRAALFEETGLNVLPLSKTDKVWWYVWDQGHSNGLEEVLTVTENIAELLLQ